MKIIAVLLSLIIISACSSEGCKELVLDTVKYHDTATEFGKEYHLYSRTTGWQDKVIFFELYKAKPIFDECMHSNISPIYARPFDDNKDRPYIKELILSPNEPEKIKITYTTDINEGIANVYDVKFSQD